MPPPSANPACTAPLMYSFAAPTAAGTSYPRARYDAMALARVQPVPCVCWLSARAALNSCLPPGPCSTSTARSPESWPPFTSTQSAPASSSTRAACSRSAKLPSVTPATGPSSVRFGVSTVASGTISCRTAAMASPASNASPCLDTDTGSTTTGTPAGRVRSSPATNRTMSADASMPVFTASTPMSSTTLRNCASTCSAGSSQAPWTPRLFCAVIAVSTLIPCTPLASIALRSAWIPAPPPESDPAIVSTLGGAVVIDQLLKCACPASPEYGAPSTVTLPAGQLSLPSATEPITVQPAGTSAGSKVPTSAWSSPPLSTKDSASRPVAAATACSTSGTSRDRDQTSITTPLAVAM